MRIEFERTGGVAGMKLATTIDSGRLSSEEAATLDRLVDEAGFFGLPSRLAASTSSPDRFQYRITVRMPDRAHTVDVHEGRITPTLRPLIDWLTAAARRPR
jgi:emfourin